MNISTLTLFLIGFVVLIVGGELMILVSFVMLLMALDGRVSRLEGGVLCAGFLAHMLFMLHEQRGTMNVSPSEEEPDRAYRGNWKEWTRNILLVFAGLALLLLGSNWLVDGAVALARALGVSELILGLTIIAIGTSLPELTTSIIAGLRGARDIAVGNVIGSNIFNILAGLGRIGPDWAGLGRIGPDWA